MKDILNSFPNPVNPFFGHEFYVISSSELFFLVLEPILRIEFREKVFDFSFEGLFGIRAVSGVSGVGQAIHTSNRIRFFEFSPIDGTNANSNNG